MKKIRLTPRAYDALFNDKDEPVVLQPRNTASKPIKPSINNPFATLTIKP